MNVDNWLNELQYQTDLEYAIANQTCQQAYTFVSIKGMPYIQICNN